MAFVFFTFVDTLYPVATLRILCIQAVSFFVYFMSLLADFLHLITGLLLLNSPFGCGGVADTEALYPLDIGRWVQMLSLLLFMRKFIG